MLFSKYITESFYDKSITTSFKKEKISESNIKKYMIDNPRLKHIRVDDSCSGYFIFDKDNLAGVISVRNDINCIQALEVFGEYKGKGISYYLLDIAVKELGAKSLTVRKTNDIAIHAYIKYGFKINKSKSTDYMYWMDKR